VDCEILLVEELFIMDKVLEVEDEFNALEVFSGDESNTGADPKVGFWATGLPESLHPV
jgi:hypothetical protein